MANVKGHDADNAVIYVKASGAGTDLDPYIPEHTVAGGATAALQGALTETAPATDTASSGLNGRLQRIAQRLTSLIALLPAALGQQDRVNSLAVTLSTEDVAALTAGGAGDASAANQQEVIDILTAVTDVPNGRVLVEANVLDRTEDSITVYAEDLSFATATITTTSATSIVSAPAAGNHLVIKKFSYQLREDVDTTATLRPGSGGTDVMAYDLDYTGANAPTTVGLDFGSGGYPLATATALYGKLSAAPSTGGVRFNIWYVVRPD